MPIASYLVHPAPGEKEQVVSRLDKLPGCEIVPAENQDVLILLTDTPDDQSDRLLSKTLKKVEGIQCLSLVYGHLDGSETQGCVEEMRNAQ